MKSDSTQNGNNRDSRREKLREKAKEFRARHGYKPFTAVPNETLEAEMMDSSLPKEARVLAAVRRFAWGNLADWAMDGPPKLEPDDKEPQVITQQQLASILHLSTSSIGEAVVFLKEQNYLRFKHPYLFPEENLNPLKSVKRPGVNPNSSESDSPFVRFKHVYLSAKPDLFQQYSTLEAEREQFYLAARERSKELKKIDRTILGAYRDEKRKQGEDENTSESAVNPNSNPDTPPVNPDSNPEPIRTPTAKKTDSRIKKAASANPVNAATKSAIKPFYTNGNHQNTTTTTIEDPAPSPSSHDPSAEFRERLALTFSRAGKPLPLRSQSEAAYKALEPHWEEFLIWIPTAREFKRTEHPGGLPTLIEMFKATLETKKKRTKETQPAEDPEAVKAEIKRMEAEMERLERETPKGRAHA